MALFKTLWQKVAGANLKDEHKVSPSIIETPLTPMLLPKILSAPDKLPTQYLPLWQLQSQRQIIEIKVKGSTRSYQSIIMAIDAERGLLWLDDLFPSQSLLELGDEISLRHHRNGEQLSFSSPIIAWGDSFGASGIAIQLPDDITYKPRRQFHRCNLSQNPLLMVKIRPIGYEPSYGNLQDLSLGGLRLSVAGNLLSQLRHGALLPLCELSLSEELKIRCSARIRAFRIERGNVSRSTHISVEFIDMTNERRKQLQEFINNVTHYQQLDFRSFNEEAELRAISA